VRPSIPTDPPVVRPVLLLHQEGILGLLAIVGLAIGEKGPLAPLAPVGDLGTSLLAGIGVGLGGSLLLWLLRDLPALEFLQRFQRQLVRDWTPADALAVAVLSGLAEEALLRALLQPVVGLLPAAILFAALHLVPDRRLWLWPVIALGLGIVFGVLFESFGYPAAAAAHIVLNALALLRLREPTSEPDE
jgi:membrane protease YdiL (CAAX protease family)